MKISTLLKTALPAIALCLASCHTKKQTANETTTALPIQQEQFSYLKKVKENTHTSQFITSKLKFSIEYGSQQLSLTGNLKMKRDDVIQMQLMAFGFVEAGRLEFTKDYVLIIDRINKQYIKAPYNYVDFLRNSVINFYTLQALFWNELFKPGQQTVDDKTLAAYTTTEEDKDVIITLEDGKLNYSWLADKESTIIRMANITYRDQFQGNTQLNWDYNEFINLNSKPFPNNMKITLTTPEKEIKLGIKLNYLKNESNWETRTKISNKYREVDIDQIIKRFMVL